MVQKAFSREAPQPTEEGRQPLTRMTYSLAGDKFSILHPNGSASALTLQVCDGLPTLTLARYSSVAGFPSGGTIFTKRLFVVVPDEDVSFGSEWRINVC